MKTISEIITVLERTIHGIDKETHAKWETHLEELRKNEVPQETHEPEEMPSMPRKLRKIRDVL